MTTPEVDQELERLFAVARAGTIPDAGARDRIRAALALRLASGTPLARRPWGQLAWLGLGAALLGACGIALWLSGGPQANNVSAPSTTDVLLPVKRAVTSKHSVPPAVTPAPTAAPELDAAPRAAPVGAPPAAPGVPASAHRASNSTPSSTPDADSAEELTLVRAMQQALRSDNASQALSLAAEHARRFPRGALVEEREGVRAVAQCQLAAPATHAAIFEAFTRRFPSSPYVARVKAACP
ncbi:MAG TPA: hypothetical protein VJN18_06420 [Polyangiaceae bacterium]|nr:hypothetical protein [Polyangiaceae bacterium]